MVQISVCNVTQLVVTKTYKTFWFTKKKKAQGGGGTHENYCMLHISNA